MSLTITQGFHLLLGFAENQMAFWDCKIHNGIRITEGSDNRDLDNWGSTVIIHVSVINTATTAVVSKSSCMMTWTVR